MKIPGRRSEAVKCIQLLRHERHATDHAPDQSALGPRPEKSALSQLAGSLLLIPDPFTLGSVKNEGFVRIVRWSPEASPILSAKLVQALREEKLQALREKLQAEIGRAGVGCGEEQL